MTLNTLNRNPFDSLPIPATPSSSGERLEPVITFYYGDYPFTKSTGENLRHPYGEDMFPGRQDYQAYFREQHGLETHVAHRTSPVRSGNVLPDVEVDTSPVFTPHPDGSDTLDNPTFSPGSLLTSSLVIDKDVETFEEPFTDRIKVARGIGLPKWQVFNYKTVQQGGNDKEWTRRLVLEPANAALPTYPATFDGIAQLYNDYGDVPVVTKPLGGAKAMGVIRHKSLYAVLAAIENDHELKTHQLQPYIDQTATIPGLKPLFSSDQAELDHYNEPGERLKEVRMSMGAFFDHDRQSWQAWTFPTLRVSDPGDVIMGPAARFFPLDPESVPEGSMMRLKTMRILGNVLIETGAAQFYGAADWIHGIGPNNEKIECSNDVNLRCPYMLPRSLFARNALMHMWGTVARQNYERSGGR